MKAGDEITCKHCGANSFLVKKSIMDGWTKKEDVLICSACSKVIHKIDDETLSEQDKQGNNDKKRLSDLSNLLGGEEVKRPTIESKEDEKRFCKDCKHRVSHPFLDRCSLLEKEVNPMDDCESFEKADANNKQDNS